MFNWIISSSRSRSSLPKSPIDPTPALLMSISISSSRFFVSSSNCAPESGSRRSSATYCARMLVKRPSSLQSAMSLSSERATSNTFLPRAASFRAKAAPIPVEAPVMRVVFITEPSAVAPGKLYPRASFNKLDPPLARSALCKSSRSSSIISALLAWSLLSVSFVGALSRLMRATAAAAPSKTMFSIS